MRISYFQNPSSSAPEENLNDIMKDHGNIAIHKDHIQTTGHTLTNMFKTNPEINYADHLIYKEVLRLVNRSREAFETHRNKYCARQMIEARINGKPKRFKPRVTWNWTLKKTYLWINLDRNTLENEAVDMKK